MMTGQLSRIDMTFVILPLFYTLLPHGNEMNFLVVPFAIQNT